MNTFPSRLRPLLDETLALACGLVDVSGRLAALEASAGFDRASDVVGVASRLWAAAPGGLRELLVTFEDRSLVVRPAEGGFCFVVFDHRSSLALVRLRLRALHETNG